ncbi:MAG: NTP transferase domain-containing protein [Bacteroidales bacterium]|nr:NTP transferase domain-containing protein [Bacteroidales bacterium]
MKAMVFAAGLGTRLRPLTDTIPKALVPLGGGTLLSNTLLKLKDSGFNDVVVNTFHFADKIGSYLRDNDGFGMRISISDERGVLDPSAPLETGGGILHARRFLEGGPFLVHNVDIISNLDIPSFVSAASAGTRLATILVSERQTSRYLLFDKEMRLAGWKNVSTGEVKSPSPELDLRGLRCLAFSGIHFISNDIFDVMDDMEASPEKYPLYDGEGRIVAAGAPGRRFSIIDFYLRAAALREVRGVTVPGLELIDVGKPETLALAREYQNPT